MNKIKDIIESDLPLNHEKQYIKAIVPQVLASIISGCFHLTVGFSVSYSAILIPQLIEDQKNGREDSIKITKNESAWIASCATLIVPFAALVAGFLMDVIGRLNVLKLSALPSLIGWITIASAKNLSMLLIGRLLVGIGCVWATSPSIVYITEISQTDLRGTLTSTARVFTYLGMTIAYTKGWFLHWRLMAWLYSGYSIIFTILVFTIPESPPWLISKGQPAKAKKSLEWLNRYHSQNCNTNSSFVEMQLLELQREHFLRHNTYKKISLRKKLKTFLQPVGYKPLLIITGLTVFQQFSGISVLTYHGVTFFMEIGSNMDPYLATIILSVVRLIMSIVSAVLMKRCSRRKLYLVSSLGMVVSLGISGLFTKWIQDGTSSWLWVPIVMLIINMLFSMIAVVPLPFVISAEFFPISIRSVAHNLNISIVNLIVFASLQSYYDLDKLLGGSYGTQFFYAIVSFAGMIYGYTFLPETFNKKLTEIEDYFWKHTIYLSGRNDKPKKTIVDLSENEPIKR